MNLKIFNVIIWAIAGVLNLACDEISKISYGMMWLVLMMYLVEKCL